MLLNDLIDPDELQAEIEAKNVRAASSGFFTILNYTDQAMREKHWNDVTTKTRGLVITQKTPGKSHSEWCVVARPWDKFFNYGEVQHWLTPDRMKAKVEVTDKMDGSLGVIFTDIYSGTGDRPRVATRGSLTSDQAKHAQNILDVKYPDFEVPGGWTFLVEIIYPENRIVLDYNGLDDLVFLGARHIETGRLVGPDAFPTGWFGPRAQVFSYDTLERALAAPLRPNAEGMVIRFLEDGFMLKIKQEDYVNLHRLVTGLSRKSVWEWMYEGNTDVFELIDVLPEEFAEWVIDVYYDFVSQINTIQIAVERLLTLFQAQTVSGPQIGAETSPEALKRARKAEFAAFVKRSGYEHPGLLYMAYEEKPWFQAVMKTFKPFGDTRMWVRSEDVA